MYSIIVTEKLTVGHVTFIIRVITRVLFYGGIYTLSDDPNGQLQHFIFQQESLSASAEFLENGVGSMGKALSSVGAAMVNVGAFGDLMSVINPQYFSLNGFSSGLMTKCGGAAGASYILGSTGYNAWAALDADPVAVVITGGKSAACYDFRYAAAFLPLALTSLLIVIWTIVLAFPSRIRGAMMLQKLYGGMAPIIVSPQPERPPADAVLIWEAASEECEPYLRLVTEDEPIVGNAAETLVGHMKDASAWLEKEMGHE